MTVNLYKIRYIMEFIRRKGKLPVDQYGQVLCASDLLAWFGLSECLTVDELSYIENELVGMIEAELAVERLKQAEQIR
jgi:hypothetical protein